MDSRSYENHYYQFRYEFRKERQLLGGVRYIFGDGHLLCLKEAFPMLGLLALRNFHPFEPTQYQSNQTKSFLRNERSLLLCFERPKEWTQLTDIGSDYVVVRGEFGHRQLQESLGRGSARHTGVLSKRIALGHRSGRAVSYIDGKDGIYHLDIKDETVEVRLRPVERSYLDRFVRRSPPRPMSLPSGTKQTMSLAVEPATDLGDLQVTCRVLAAPESLQEAAKSLARSKNLGETEKLSDCPLLRYQWTDEMERMANDICDYLVATNELPRKRLRRDKQFLKQTSGSVHFSEGSTNVVLPCASAGGHNPTGYLYPWTSEYILICGPGGELPVTGDLLFLLILISDPEAGPPPPVESGVCV